MSHWRWTPGKSAETAILWQPNAMSGNKLCRDCIRRPVDTYFQHSWSGLSLCKWVYYSVSACHFASSIAESTRKDSVIQMVRSIRRWREGKFPLYSSRGEPKFFVGSTPRRGTPSSCSSRSEVSVKFRGSSSWKPSLAICHLWPIVSKLQGRLSTLRWPVLLSVCRCQWQRTSVLGGYSSIRRNPGYVLWKHSSQSRRTILQIHSSITCVSWTWYLISTR